MPIEAGTFSTNFGRLDIGPAPYNCKGVRLSICLAASHDGSWDLIVWWVAATDRAGDNHAGRARARRAAAVP